MVTLFRLVPMLAVLAVPALVMAADDADARARAALALAVAKQAPPVVAERPGRTPEQAAKAALAEAMGKACDCGLCPPAKPMPPATPPAAAKDAPKRSVEKLTYAELTKAVAKLAAGESLRVYVGQMPVDSATGRIIELTDKIPGEKQIVGVWRCWRETDGTAKMQSLHPDDKPTRVIIAGRYYDRHADGSLFWCVECNGG